MREQANRVVTQYLNDPITDISAMDFWKEYEKTEDIVKLSLVQCAEKFLTPENIIPVASTVDERMFSTGGDIITKERNRLKPENARKILFCREGAPVLNFRYYKEGVKSEKSEKLM